jgi:hypothetical protein
VSLAVGHFWLYERDALNDGERWLPVLSSHAANRAWVEGRGLLSALDVSRDLLAQGHGVVYSLQQKRNVRRAEAWCRDNFL